VLRRLHLRRKTCPFPYEILLDMHDLTFIDRQVAEFRPDVVYLGHAICLTKALLPSLADCAVPLVYDEGGEGLMQARKNRGRWFYFTEEYVSGSALVDAIKPLIIHGASVLSQGQLKTRWAWPRKMRVFFNSERGLRIAAASGVPVDDAQVIHSGIDVDKFPFRPRSAFGSTPSILVPGRADSRKGLKDAVGLLAEMRRIGFTATALLVGYQSSNSYRTDVLHLAEKLHLENMVTFKPMVTRDHLVSLYHQSDVCFFPSYQEVGYSRTPLEAMACGCVVVTYGNEGSDEVIRDGETGFLAKPGCPAEAADAIKELILRPEVVRKVTQAARRQIEEECSIEKYVDRVERVLMNAAEER
jgi:glycosyltransferase involved in cell wall biosynthesis